MGKPIDQLSAGEIAAAVAARERTAAEVTGALLERIAALNPVLNAICTLNPDAMAAAEACDRRLASGAAARPLEGVPFVVKDIIPTARRQREDLVLRAAAAYQAAHMWSSIAMR